MNVVLQYVVAVVCTLIAHFFQTWFSNVASAFGLMMSEGVRRSVARHTPTSGVVSEGYQKGLLRSQLFGALASGIIAIIAAAVLGALIAYWTPSASWIPGLWFLAIAFYSLGLLRISIWLFIKSFFVSVGSLQTSMLDWQVKNGLVERSP